MITDLQTKFTPLTYQHRLHRFGHVICCLNRLSRSSRYRQLSPPYTITELTISLKSAPGRHGNRLTDGQTTDLLPGKGRREVADQNKPR